MFCAPGQVFGGTENVGSRFHVLRVGTHFQRNRGRRLPFSCFFIPGVIFGSRIHVLRARTCFRRHRGRQVPFSCFALPDSFSAVLRALGPVFLFCALRLVFGVSEGVGSRFQVLRSWTHFRRYRGRPVPFSCFVLPDMFSAVPRVSGPVFMFCTPGLVFGGTMCVGSCFHVFSFPDSFSAVHRVSGPVFLFCAPDLIFDGTDDIGYRFHVL
jgi:hypothetical protein